MKKLTEIILIGALLLVSYPSMCDAKNYSEVAVKINIGQSKQAIIELIGKPRANTIFVKRHKFIWGPEESFWDDIPMGTRLEVWHYDFSDGHLSLYFINGGDHLDYKAFAPKGVVY
jgi:hypothetical protein